ALWKAAKPGEPQWPSPWSQGRPGWHIECSAMSMKYLGESFDMHGGGRDLMFPHHENEIAQSEAATGKPFVRYWMHNGLLYTAGQKMSKSLGNFFLMEDLLAKFSPEELRFFLLSTHFRSQAEYSEERLAESRAAFERIREGIVRLHEALGSADSNGGAMVSEAAADLRESTERLQREFLEAMDHDFNTAGALGKVFEIVRHSNRFLDAALADGDAGVLREVFERLQSLLQLLGFYPNGLGTAAQQGAGRAPAEIEALAQQRVEARAARDFEAADALRNQISERGWIVEDRPDGYRLKKGT
ncbi:MAG: class I tRNA ligase family protein, partial [Gammaproteobacteria bacterium]|nr:class I tRNA ligase family protein [Gammaproteobacteria bacterium]